MAFKKRRKHKLSPTLRIWIDVFCLDVSLGTKTIDEIEHPILKDIILEELRVEYGLDGYGKPLNPEGEDQPKP